MNLKHMAMSFALGLAASTLQAQQSMPDMPGMNAEPPKPRPKQPAATPRPNPLHQLNQPTPCHSKDIDRDTGNAKAQAEAANAENSASQQSAPSPDKPALNSDQQSLKLPIQELQEPEAVGFRTGTDLPAPELLREVLTQKPLMLEYFMDLADNANPTLAQAQHNVHRSQQQARQVGLPPNPTIGYSGDHIRGGEYGGGEQGAFVSQEFVLGHKLALRRDVFRAEGRSNQVAVDIQRARIHADVARAFIDALATQQAVIIHGRLLAVALDSETNSHELERVGQADASDVLNAEIAAEQAKVEYVNAQRMFLAAFTQLATFAGQTSLVPHPLAGNLLEPPQLNPEAIVQTDMQESPAVKQAEANVVLAEARIKSAKRESVPNFNLKAGEWYSGEHLGATAIPAGPESFVEASVQLPLWNRNQGNVETSKFELDRARQEITRTQLYIRDRAEQYAQQYQTARYTADKYRTEMLPRARRAYELEVTKYQQMAQSYPHVLSAQRTLFVLQLTYIQALNQEWQAATALQNYTLMNGLDEPMTVGQDSTTMNLPTVPGASN